MNIQEKLIQNYPLINKVDSELNCYLLDKKRYLVFWDELIKKDSIEEVLNYLEEKTKNTNFTEYNTLIVVGKTKDKFTKSDLLYFNSVNKIVVFYLINEETNDVYMDDSWISFLGLNYKKYVRKINEIINKSKENYLKQNLDDTLKYYCKKELEEFVSSSIYSKLNKLVESHRLNLKLDFGNAVDEKDKNLYLSLSVFDKNGNLVEIFDDGFLTTSTTLIMVDKKDRYKFFSWKGKEFIDDLNWIIKNIKEINNE